MTILLPGTPPQVNNTSISFNRAMSWSATGGCDARWSTTSSAGFDTSTD